MPDPAPLRVLSIATLFPDASRPNFGIFVERSLAALAEQPGVTLTIVAPVGMPPWPLSLHPRYAALRALPQRETWRGLTVLRPRFHLIPGLARRNAAAMASAVLPIARDISLTAGLDIIDAQFFWPDGPAAQRVASALALPYSVKARGSDISLWAKAPATTSLISDAADRAAGLLAVSTSLRADMITLGMAADKIRVHYTGVDAGRFAPLDRAEARARWQVAGEAPVLLTVGALIPRKGQAKVIAAMAALPADTRYLIAGSGGDAARLVASAQAAGVADRMQLLGAVDNAELPSLYSAADVMVLPSASEGLANAWVEAMACGTPLVLADIPPAHEVIDSDAAGRIAADGPDGLAAAIRAVLADPPDRARLSAGTHARFDWARNGAELAAHLREMAGNGSGGGT